MGLGKGNENERSMGLLLKYRNCLDNNNLT